MIKVFLCLSPSDPTLRASLFLHSSIRPGSGRQFGPTLLLLHGTGGNEDDLLSLGRELSPQSALLSPRGKVLEHGMPRFFRRLAEGVFDEADLILRAGELAAFVLAAAAQYGLDAKRVVAVGYSNGANIAAGVLLLHPGVLAGAVLFRAMVPLAPKTPPTLGGTKVLIESGRTDSMIPAASAEELAGMLREAGAEVTQQWTPGGHSLTAPEIDEARAWLAREWQRA